MTLWGFWVVAALSSQTSGRPFTISRRIGKSRRTASTSKSSEDRFKFAGSGRAPDVPGAGTGPAAEGGYEKAGRASSRNEKTGNADSAPAGTPGTAGAGGPTATACFGIAAWSCAPG